MDIYTRSKSESHSPAERLGLNPKTNYSTTEMLSLLYYFPICTFFPIFPCTHLFPSSPSFKVSSLSSQFCLTLGSAEAHSPHIACQKVGTCSFFFTRSHCLFSLIVWNRLLTKGKSCLQNDRVVVYIPRKNETVLYCWKVSKLIVFVHMKSG